MNFLSVAAAAFLERKGRHDDVMKFVAMKTRRIAVENDDYDDQFASAYIAAYSIMKHIETFVAIKNIGLYKLIIVDGRISLVDEEATAKTVLMLTTTVGRFIRLTGTWSYVVVDVTPKLDVIAEEDEEDGGKSAVIHRIMFRILILPMLGREKFAGQHPRMQYMAAWICSAEAKMLVEIVTKKNGMGGVGRNR